MQDYYQVYQDGLPLKGHLYATIKLAKNSLYELHNNYQAVSPLLGYTVQRRIPHLPISRIMSLVLTYSDGSTKKTTFLIHQIKNVRGYSLHGHSMGTMDV